VDVTKHDGRPLSQVPSEVASGHYYRFHSRRHFFASPDEFYRNFLESLRTWNNQARFAGRCMNSGFYFAKTPEVAIAETIFYQPALAANPRLASVSSLIRALRTVGKDVVLLRVTLSHDRIADLTDPETVRRFYTDGTLAASPFTPAWAVTVVADLLSQDRGGDGTTDTLGYDAVQAGFQGVLFPSVRALSGGTQLGFDPPPGSWVRQGRDDFGGWIGDEAGLIDAMANQLRREHNLVLFSGSQTCRSISDYAWTENGVFCDPIPNPCYRLRPEELEALRLAERRRQSLDADAALEVGLVSDREIADELPCEAIPVSLRLSCGCYRTSVPTLRHYLSVELHADRNDYTITDFHLSAASAPTDSNTLGRLARAGDVTRFGHHVFDLSCNIWPSGDRLVVLSDKIARDSRLDWRAFRQTLHDQNLVRVLERAGTDAVVGIGRAGIAILFRGR
jgi:hypothetical protein